MKPVFIQLLSHESKVRNGLSLTPVDMDEMSTVHRSLLSHQMDNNSYSDPFEDPTALPLYQHRGVDMNTVWEAAELSKRKINGFVEQRRFDASFNLPQSE